MDFLKYFHTIEILRVSLGAVPAEVRPTEPGMTSVPSSVTFVELVPLVVLGERERDLVALEGEELGVA